MQFTWPAQGAFEPRRAHQPLVLWTAGRKERERAFRAAVAEIVSRIQSGESAEWRCPDCGRELCVTNMPALFDVRCKQGCFVYNFHRDPETGQMAHGHFFTNGGRAFWDGARHAR